MGGDDGQGVTHEVANPDHVELVDLLADVRNYQGLNSDVLRVPEWLMGSGGAWTGPSAARVFTQELQGRHASLPRRFEESVDAVLYELSRVPQTVIRAG